MLSHQMAGLWWCRVGTACSSTRKCMSIPMSSRIDMEIVPLGLLAVTRLFLISRGHFRYQTMGASGRKPRNHTPPTPQLDASQKPWYEAKVRGVSSCICVGLLLISWGKLVQVVQYYFMILQYATGW